MAEKTLTLTGQAADLKGEFHMKLIDLKCTIRDLFDEAIEQTRVEWEAAQKADLIALQAALDAKNASR